MVPVKRHHISYSMYIVYKNRKKRSLMLINTEIQQCIFWFGYRVGQLVESGSLSFWQLVETTADAMLGQISFDCHRDLLIRCSNVTGSRSTDQSIRIDWLYTEVLTKLALINLTK